MRFTLRERWSMWTEWIFGAILDRILDIDPSTMLWFIASLAILMFAILMWVLYGTPGGIP